MATETKTFYPGAYDANLSSFLKITDPTNFVGKGSTSTGSYTLITADYYTPANCYWPFDVSDIPSDADIDSVSCVVKASKTSETTMEATLQLCCGNVNKGSSVSLSGAQTVKTYTISAGTWTRSELETIRLRTSITSSSKSSRGVYLYGADLTVTYTYQSEKFMLKLGGSWAGASRVFKKVSGIWVEQTDLANVIEDGVRYQNGGEYVAPAPTTIPVTITGTGNSKYCFATINGTKYASAASGIEVMPGDTIQFTVCGDAHTTYVTINGTKVHTGNPYSMTSYAWTIPDGVFSISIKLYDDGSTAQITVTTK